MGAQRPVAVVEARREPLGCDGTSLLAAGGGRRAAGGGWPGGEAVIVPGAGHCLVLDAPAAYARVGAVAVSAA
ncbi:hypothetical protein [Actinacidiphila acidipaludis]|uniref:Alpha/beta hydrolase n=1 Tax=Actinacidiphila acidipaludis TaxID=2873382 RepID=A0ABS7QHZ2_9ACTN|nr:hypothetical protein [Streptomyces acidipaludis]MBY8882791.1 hypothetical protein [Streptomyces acidipaludis]